MQVDKCQVVRKSFSNTELKKLISTMYRVHEDEYNKRLQILTKDEKFPIPLQKFVIKNFFGIQTWT